MARSRRGIALVLLLLPLLCPSPVPAQGLTLEVQSRTGVLYGLARELVYHGSDIISELDWRFQPVVYAGTALKLQTVTGLSAVVDVRAAFPGRSGYMEDSDYLNYEYDDLSLTHYSRHDCHTERSVTLDTRVGWAFGLGEGFGFQPFAAFSLMLFEWTARDGYFQYPLQPSAPYTPWSQDTTKAPVSGTVIVYQQSYLIPAAGFSVFVHLGEHFDADLSFAFSPFVFCNDLDNHVQRAPPWDTDYYDYLRWGLLVEPALTLGFRPSSKARLSLGFSYRRIWGLVGDSYKVNAGLGWTPGEVAATYPDSAGASYDALDACLALSLSL
jgi:outer membrane protease